MYIYLPSTCSVFLQKGSCVMCIVWCITPLTIMYLRGAHTINRVRNN